MFSFLFMVKQDILAGHVEGLGNLSNQSCKHDVTW